MGCQVFQVTQDAQDLRYVAMELKVGRAKVDRTPVGGGCDLREEGRTAHAIERV